MYLAGIVSYDAMAGQVLPENRPVMVNSNEMACQEEKGNLGFNAPLHPAQRIWCSMMRQPRMTVGVLICHVRGQGLPQVD